MMLLILILNTCSWIPRRQIYGSSYSRIDQARFFKGCLPQMLLGPFLNTLTHMFTVSNKDSERSTIKVVLESILMNPGSWYCWWLVTSAFLTEFGYRQSPKFFFSFLILCGSVYLARSSWNLKLVCPPQKLVQF